MPGHPFPPFRPPALPSSRPFRPSAIGPSALRPLGAQRSRSTFFGHPSPVARNQEELMPGHQFLPFGPIALPPLAPQPSTPLMFSKVAPHLFFVTRSPSPATTKNARLVTRSRPAVLPSFRP